MKLLRQQKKLSRSVVWMIAGISTCSLNLGQAADIKDPIEKGKYLATAGGCIACHTKPGGEPYAGGRSIATPFGTIASPNITPDKETGIGNWTDDQFYRSMHEGIGKNGEYLYPVFPFTSYTKVTLEDALAIKSYLFSQKPVHAQNEKNNLAFPYNIRSALLVWRELYFKPAEFKPDPQKSTEINRGAYLVEGLEHCGECHTPRSLLGASEKGAALQGASVQGWYAPNITSDWSQGIGSWSSDELFGYLKTGASPRHGVAAGPMSEVVHENLGQLNDTDVHAIVAYLKAFPAAESDKSTPRKVSSDAKTAGASLYLDNCASCHQLNGKGILNHIPPLSGNGSVTANGADNIIKVVLSGLPASDTYGPMSSFAASLKDREIADIANYVRQSWGNNASANATESQVAKIRQDTPILLALGDGDMGCPVQTEAGEKAVTDEAKKSVISELEKTNIDNLFQSAVAIVPRVKQALPQAKIADLVNGLTIAWCQIVAKRPDQNAVEKRLILDRFSQLVYAQLTHFSLQQTSAPKTEKPTATP